MAKTKGKKLITVISHTIVLAIGFGAGGYFAYDYAKKEGVHNPLNQQLGIKISDLERKIRVLNATIRELEDASKAKTTDVGDLTFYKDLPSEEVSPEPLETGKAVRIGTAITPATHTESNVPAAKEMAANHHLTATLDELNHVKTQPAVDTGITEKANNFTKDIPSAGAMNAEVAKQAIPQVASTGLYRVQASSFQHEADANALKNKLSQQGVAASIKAANVNGRTWYRVQVGPYASLSDAQAAKSSLKSIVKGDMLIVKSAR